MGRSARIPLSFITSFKALFIETNPIPIKTALAMLGKVKEVFRSPLCRMDPKNREKLKMVLENQKIL